MPRIQRILPLCWNSRFVNLPNFGCFCLTTLEQHPFRLAMLHAVVQQLFLQNPRYIQHKYARIFKAVYDGKQNRDAKNQKQDKLLLQRVTAVWLQCKRIFMFVCSNWFYFLVCANWTKLPKGCSFCDWQFIHFGDRKFLDFDLMTKI